MMWSIVVVLGSIMLLRMSLSLFPRSVIVVAPRKSIRPSWSLAYSPSMFEFAMWSALRWVSQFVPVLA
eukprot:4089056-Heterocapsa_arctica.AAC.1